MFREIAEETGFTGFQLMRHIATYDHWDASEQIINRRHVYHLMAPAHLPERWTHGEKFDTPEQITFDFYWVPLKPAPKLIANDKRVMRE